MLHVIGLNSSNLWMAVLYVSIWRCSSIFNALCNEISVFDGSAVSPWIPSPGTHKRLDSLNAHTRRSRVAYHLLLDPELFVSLSVDRANLAATLPSPGSILRIAVAGQTHAHYRIILPDSKRSYRPQFRASATAPPYSICNEKVVNVHLSECNSVG